MNLTMKQIEEVIGGAVEATLESIAAWPEPTSPPDAVTMLRDRLRDDFADVFQRGFEAFVSG